MLYAIMLYAGSLLVCHSVPNVFSSYQFMFQTWQCSLFGFLLANSKRFVNSFFLGGGVYVCVPAAYLGHIHPSLES